MKALNSNENFIFLLSSSSMSVHMIVSIVGHSFLSKSYLCSYWNFYSKALVIATLLTLDLIQLFVVIPNSDFSMYVLIRFIRFFMFGMISLFYLAYCGWSIWNSYAPLNEIFVVYSGFAIKYFLNFIDAFEFSLLSPISLCLQIIGARIIRLRTYRWCVYLYRNKAEGKNITSDEYCCNVYLTGFCSIGVGQNYGFKLFQIISLIGMK